MWLLMRTCYGIERQLRGIDVDFGRLAHAPPTVSDAEEELPELEPITPEADLLPEEAFETFYPTRPAQQYCSRACGIHDPGPSGPRLSRRKVERPPYDQLIAELEASNFSAVGRKYGVSDNAVRKWLRWYEQERTDEAA